MSVQSDPVQPTNGAHNAPQGGTPRKALWLRGLYMVIVALLIGAAQSMLFLLTLVQFVMMLIARGMPNAQIADAGDVLGRWMAQAAKFQSVKSDVKPWPFGPLT